jgi:hypothetical protein
MDTQMRQILIAFTALAAAAPAAARQVDVHTHVAVRTEMQQERQPPARVIVQQGRDRRGGPDGREEQRETFKKVVRLGSSGELDVSNMTGDITIVRGGGNDATIEVTKVARAQTVDDARELLPLVKVEINERGNRTEIRTIYPGQQENMFRNRRGFNVSVHYMITAPAGTRLTARTLTGNLRATEITGELSLVTTSGNVQVARAGSVAAVKSTSGSIEVSDTNSQSPIEASTVSGNIVMRQVKAPRVELGTVSGTVTMTDLQCGRVEADSLSGDVEYAGALMKGGRYEINSHSGNVRLTMAPGSGFEVEANSWSGKVETDLQISGNRDQEPDRRGGRRSKTLRGVVGDGSATLDITTFSGNVWIGKR